MSSDPGWRLPRTMVEHVGKGRLQVPPAGPLDEKGRLPAQRLRVQREIAEDSRVPVRCTCALRSSSLTIKSSASRMNCVMASVSLTPGSALRSIACVACSRAQFQPMPRL